MIVLARAVTYAALLVGLVLMFLPARLLSWSGIMRPATIGVPQLAGVVMGAAGGALALWCVLAFVFLGRGTPAPFDPPRRLVVQGPYRVVRNPMYIGAGLALAGAALEEPTLRRAFGGEYEEYCRCVRRWWPRLRPSQVQIPGTG